MSRIKTKFITDAAITNAKLADMAQSTIKGRAAAAGTGVPVDLSAAQVKTILDLTGTNSGDVTLAAVGASPNANGASLSGQQLTLQPFSSTQPGVVTASGGGTTNFLRADGTFAAPGGNAITALTGDVVATGPGSVSATLATVNSNVGSFTNANITVNAKGLITAAANGTGGSSGPTIFGSRSTPRSIVAATGITSGASHMSTSADRQDIYLEGSITGDSVAATISAGTVDGQTMRLVGRNLAKTVTISATGTTNIYVNGNCTLGLNATLTLRWDTSEWVEVSRTG